MIHAAAHTLIGYADNELPPRERAELLQHLRECAYCDAQLMEIKATRSSLGVLLGQMDAAEPTRWRTGLATEYVTRVTAPPVTRPLRSVWRWAATIVLLSASAVAGATLLRSMLPVRRDLPPAAAPVPVTRAPAAQPAGGVSIEAQDGRVDVQLADVAAGTRLRVRVTNDVVVSVQFFGDNAPTFVAQRGRVLARLNGSPAELRLAIPANLVSVRIMVHDDVIAIVESGTMRMIKTDDRIEVEADPT